MKIVTKMKKSIVLFVLMVIGLNGYAQQKISSSNMSEFHSVDLAGNLRVELIEAETPRIEVILNKTDANKFTWSVNGETLNMRLKPGNASDANAEVKIYYVKLKSMKISGANVAVKDTLDQVMIDIDMSAGATLGIAVDAKDVNLNITGNSVADIVGAVKYYAVSASSKSKVNTRSLMAEDADVHAGSGAEVYVAAVERLHVVSDSGASVYYKGEPEIARLTTRLMGTINNIGK